jgi:hypothetical protein
MARRAGGFSTARRVTPANQWSDAGVFPRLRLPVDPRDRVRRRHRDLRVTVPHELDQHRQRLRDSERPERFDRDDPRRLRLSGGRLLHERFGGVRRVETGAFEDALPLLLLFEDVLERVEGLLGDAADALARVLEQFDEDGIARRSKTAPSGR